MSRDLAGADIKEMKDKDCTSLCTFPDLSRRISSYALWPRFRRVQEQVLGKLEPHQHNPQTHHRRCERIRCMSSGTIPPMSEANLFRFQTARRWLRIGIDVRYHPCLAHRSLWPTRDQPWSHPWRRRNSTPRPYRRQVEGHGAYSYRT